MCTEQKGCCDREGEDFLQILTSDEQGFTIMSRIKKAKHRVEKHWLTVKKIFKPKRQQEKSCWKGFGSLKFQYFVITSKSGVVLAVYCYKQPTLRFALKQGKASQEGEMSQKRGVRGSQKILCELTGKTTKKWAGNYCFIPLIVLTHRPVISICMVHWRRYNVGKVSRTTRKW